MSEPIQKEYRENMNKIARLIDTVFNKGAKDKNEKVAFVLLVAPFGDDEGRCSYISNGDRKDIISLMKEMIARFEGQANVKGNA